MLWCFPFIPFCLSFRNKQETVHIAWSEKMEFIWLVVPSNCLWTVIHYKTLRFISKAIYVNHNCLDNEIFLVFMMMMCLLFVFLLKTVAWGITFLCIKSNSWGFKKKNLYPLCVKMAFHLHQFRLQGYCDFKCVLFLSSTTAGKLLKVPLNWIYLFLICIYSIYCQLPSLYVGHRTILISSLCLFQDSEAGKQILSWKWFSGLKLEVLSVYFTFSLSLHITYLCNIFHIPRIETINNIWKDEALSKKILENNWTTNLSVATSGSIW